MSLLLALGVNISVRVTDLPPAGPVFPIQSWTYSYLKTLIGQDALPTGARLYDLPPVGSEPNPRRDWEWRQVGFIGLDRLPNRQQDWPNPQPVQWYQTWAVFQLGELELSKPPFIQQDWPLPIGAEPNPRRDWAWRQVGFIGLDVLPIRQQDWPNPQPIQWYRFWNHPSILEEELLVPTGVQFYSLPPVGYEPNPRRTWEWWYNYNLIGQDRLPNRQQDWPVPEVRLEPNPRRSWEWRQVGYLGQDRLPNRQQDWPNPYPVQWYQSWELGRLSVEELEVPVGTQYFPQPPPLNWYQSWEYQYLKTLIGQDKLPFRQQDWPLGLPNEISPRRSWEWSQVKYLGLDTLPFREQDWPNPYPVVWYKDWEFSQFIPLISTIATPLNQPFNQRDWPLPYPVQWYRDWEAWYNYNLIGQDKLPIRQQDWPNPYPVTWYRDWEFGEFIPFISVTTTPLGQPFNQFNWPNPYPLSWYKSWEFPPLEELELLVPFNQKDWPNPYPIQWYRSLEEAFPLSLIGQDKLPIRQQDWPVPIGFYRPDGTWVNFVFIPNYPTTTIPMPLLASTKDWPLPVAVFRPDGTFVQFAFIPNYPAVVSVPDLHFKPHLISIGRMGALGGLS